MHIEAPIFLCGLPLCTNIDPQCTSLYFVPLTVLMTVGRLKLRSWTRYTSVEYRLPSHYRCRLQYSTLARVNACGGTHVHGSTFLSSHANAMMSCEHAQGVPLQCLVPPSMKHVDNIWSLYAVLL